jgi:hypothetical protein
MKYLLLPRSRSMHAHYMTPYVTNYIVHFRVV